MWTVAEAIPAFREATHTGMRGTHVHIHTTCTVLRVGTAPWRVRRVERGAGKFWVLREGQVQMNKVPNGLEVWTQPHLV